MIDHGRIVLIFNQYIVILKDLITVYAFQWKQTVNGNKY